MKRYFFVFAGIIMATLTSCNKSSKTQGDALSATPQAVTADAGTVKITGRTFTKNGALYLAQSAAAVEFIVNAKALSIDLAGDITAHPVRGTPPTNWARYAIYVDGALVTTGTMDRPDKTEAVFAEQSPRTATVRLVKLTEAAQSVFAVKAIRLDEAGTIRPVPPQEFKIEFIGDSITCGYGVEAANEFQPFTTQTENAEKSYAYLTSLALSADYSFVSYSGHGIYSGYTGEGVRNTDALLPPYYGTVCHCYSTGEYNDYRWDFGRFQPNLIVINLGTNDASYCKTPELRALYTEGYVAFLKEVRSHNPSAYILCALGIMGDELFPALEQAAATYSAETGDGAVGTFRFTPQDGGTDGYGADWHPSAKTQRQAAEALTAHIVALRNGGVLR